MRVYLDSCIVIYSIEGTLDLRQQILNALQTYTAPSFLISDLVRMECLIGPLRDHNQLVLNLYNDFFRHTDVLHMDGNVFDFAAQIRATANIRTPDALHLAVASLNACDEFLTNDRRLSNIIPGLNVRILDQDIR